jgi:predicted nuclease of predicted toxin-antitoxin system
MYSKRWSTRPGSHKRKSLAPDAVPRRYGCGYPGGGSWLRAEGHDAAHLREQGLHRMPDKEIFQKAATEERMVLTFDLDFGEIVALSAQKPASVILFRLRNTHTPHVVDRLRVALAESKKALEAGAVIIVEEARLRTRRLPIK